MGKTCAFFGHRCCFASAEELKRLDDTIETLITQYNVDTFYLCRNGEFDMFVLSAVFKAQQKYPHISRILALAYLPVKQTISIEVDKRNYDKVVVPEGSEDGPVRFSITRRNRALVRDADYIVCYVTVNRGGAWSAVRYAKRLKKVVFNIANRAWPLD